MVLQLFFKGIFTRPISGHLIALGQFNLENKKYYFFKLTCRLNVKSDLIANEPEDSTLNLRENSFFWSKRFRIRKKGKATIHRESRNLFFKRIF